MSGCGAAKHCVVHVHCPRHFRWTISALLLLGSCSFIDENADGSRPDDEGVGQLAEDSPLSDLDLSAVDPEDLDFGGPVDEIRVMQPGDGIPLRDDFGWRVLDSRHVLSLEDDMGMLDFWVARIVESDIGPGIQICTATWEGSGGGASCGSSDIFDPRTTLTVAGGSSGPDSNSVELHGGSEAVAFVVETDGSRIGLVPVAGFAFYRSSDCPSGGTVTTFYVDGTSRDEPLGRFC